jgi:predicted acylesterase/phospholipase RssA
MIFDTSTFEDTVKKVFNGSPLVSDKPLNNSTPSCKTFVVTRVSNGREPIYMRSYKTLDESFPMGVKIWQAARATAAAPTFFDPIVIEHQTYDEGPVEYNNPTWRAMEEAHRIWPGRKIGCLISVGTGLEDVFPLGDQSSLLVRKILRPEPRKLWWKRISQLSPSKPLFQLEVAKYCVECLTSCERVHREIAERNLDGTYFRLNVPQGMSAIGLDEWRKLGEMIALTQEYMDHSDVRSMKIVIAKLLLKSE